MLNYFIDLIMYNFLRGAKAWTSEAPSRLVQYEGFVRLPLSRLKGYSRTPSLDGGSLNFLHFHASSGLSKHYTTMSIIVSFPVKILIILFAFLLFNPRICRAFGEGFLPRRFTMGSPRPFGSDRPTKAEEFNRTGVLLPEYQLPATLNPNNVSQ